MPPTARRTPAPAMRFLILMLPEWGAYLPTLALAKALRDLHHEVVYAGLPLIGDEPMAAFAEHLEREGFRFQVLNLSRPPGARPALLSGGRAERAIRAVGELIAREGFDLTLVDGLVSYLAIPSCLQGVPAVGVKATLLSTFGPEQPPFTSHLAAGREEVGKLRVLAAWVQRRLELVVLASLRDPLAAPYRLAWIGPRAYIRRLARRLGFEMRFTEYGWRVQIPDELYLCPAEWEIPPRPGRWYGGAALDPSRAEEPVAPYGLREEADLVVCSLGTHSDRYPGAERFFRTVVEAFARMPELDLVLHVGHGIDLERLGPLPENVRAERWIPQLALLRRATLMITHAGLGTVKECIAAGVPMLAFPAGYDQPGNAARIERHGLGKRGDYTRVTPTALAERITSMLARREELRPALERMRRAFTDHEPTRAAAERLEAMAARTRGSAPPGRSGPEAPGPGLRRPGPPPGCEGPSP